jgi:hypothetical protein
MKEFVFPAGDIQQPADQQQQPAQQQQQTTAPHQQQQQQQQVNLTAQQQQQQQQQHLPGYDPKAAAGFTPASGEKPLWCACCVLLFQHLLFSSLCV